MSRNGVLAVLSEPDLQRLAPDLAPLDLPLNEPLAVANEPIFDMYFLTSGIASTVATGSGNGPIEIGITGSEGFVSLPVVLGADRSPNDTYMQLAGYGLRIPADRLLAAMAASPALTLTLTRFAHIFMLQSASSALANGRATLEARLARWLLMAHDRVDGEALDMTHGFLSMMLGVRRAGVTVALSELERRGFVGRQRGSVVMLDRPGLELIATGYYGAAEDEYRRLFGRALRRS